MRPVLVLTACVALLMTSACSAVRPPAVTVAPDAPVVVPYTVDGGGEIRFTVKPRYPVGEPIALDIDITAGSLQVRGPESGVVLQSDLAGEQTIRRLTRDDLSPVLVGAGTRRRIVVTWDARRDDGTLVPAETFSLALDFIVGSASRRVGTVIEVRER